MSSESPRERADVVQFLERVSTELGAVVRSDGRLSNGEQLLTRFEEVVDRFLERGWEYYGSVQEVHNELCTAALVLEDTAEPLCTELTCEPAVPRCDQRSDFRVGFDKSPPAWLEVKTIHPEPLDRWKAYERDVCEGRFPENARLILNRSWLGGELYHKYFSARSRILEYTAQTERKVAACLGGSSESVFLVLFSNGFDWHRDHLEDFLHFYRFGVHFEGDHFRLMEERYVEDNGISFDGSITHFSYVKRPSGAIRPVGGKWSVRPVQFSPDRGFF